MDNSDRSLWKMCAVQLHGSTQPQLVSSELSKKLMDLEAVENGAKRTAVTNKRCDPILTLRRRCKSKEAVNSPHGLFKLKSQMTIAPLFREQLELPLLL
jgi:hypothetical protein